MPRVYIYVQSHRSRSIWQQPRGVQQVDFRFQMTRGTTPISPYSFAIRQCAGAGGDCRTFHTRFTISAFARRMPTAFGMRHIAIAQTSKNFSKIFSSNISLLNSESNEKKTPKSLPISESHSNSRSFRAQLLSSISIFIVIAFLLCIRNCDRQTTKS